MNRREPPYVGSEAWLARFRETGGYSDSERARMRPTPRYHQTGDEMEREFRNLVAMVIHWVTIDRLSDWEIAEQWKLLGPVGCNQERLTQHVREELSKVQKNEDRGQSHRKN